MGFVEAITSKVLQQGKDFFPQLTADLVLPCRAGKELFLHAVKELCLLFSHGAAQDIGFAQAETAEHGDNLHDLFLIKDDAVRIGYNGFHKGMQDPSRALSMTAGNEVLRHTAS